MKTKKTWIDSLYNTSFYSARIVVGVRCEKIEEKNPIPVCMRLLQDCWIHRLLKCSIHHDAIPDRFGKFRCVMAFPSLHRCKDVSHDPVT